MTQRLDFAVQAAAQGMRSAAQDIQQVDGFLPLAEKLNNLASTLVEAKEDQDKKVQQQEE